MSFKLLVHCPFPTDGTSVYRGWGPMGELRDDTLDIIEPPSASYKQIDWTSMKQIDAVFLQRPFQPVHVQLADIAKKYKKPVWVDFDDDLFCVPEDNPTHDMYGQKAVKDSVATVCQMANVITVSTEQLKKKLSQYNSNIIVVPNALDLNLLHRMDSNIPRQKAVVWRGSHTHFADMHLYTEEIMNAYIRYPEWSWVFFGYNPTWITKNMNKERWRYLPFSNDYLTYMNNLQRMRGAIHIVPLVDSEFNRAKSNVCQLESSFAGSALLVPDWEEWQGGRMMKYTKKENFGNSLQSLLSKSLEELQAINADDWKWVMENRSLTKINSLRRGAVMQLQGGM